jgi:glutaminase
MFNHEHRRPSPVRRTFTLAEMTSRRVRDPAVAAAILRDGARVRAFELQGDIGFAEAEQIERAVIDAEAELVVLDLRRVSDIHRAAVGLLAGLGDHVSALSAAPQELCEALAVPTFDELDRALEWCEDRLTGDTEVPSLPGVRDHPVLRDVGGDDLARLEAVLVPRTFVPGEFLLRAGEPVTELFLLTKGIASETLVGPDGRTRRLTTVTSGMTVGEMALVGDTRRIGDVRADTEVEAYSLAAEALAGLGGLDAELRARLLRNLLAIIAARVQSTRAGLMTLID